MTAGPNHYDVLDVDGTASTDEIRDAWRAAIADLTPADRRFRLYNHAAEVLLDPERRAAYDAELAAQVAEESEAAPEPATAVSATPAPAAGLPSIVLERLRRTRRGGPTVRARGWTVPAWLLVGLGVLALASVVLTSYLLTQPSEGSVEDAAASARSAAERAIEPVLSYDYRDLGASQDAAHEFVTSDYRKEYDRLFEGLVTGNAKDTKTVVEAELVASSVVRGGEDRVELLLFVDQATTNVANEKPIVYKNQVRVFMERTGEEWLVDCLITQPDGTCPS